MELVQPLLAQRMAAPTLRANLRVLGEMFVTGPMHLEDQDIQDYSVSNRMSKQKRCHLCPRNLDRKTYFKCLARHEPMCKDHVAKICCDCSSDVIPAAQE